MKLPGKVKILGQSFTIRSVTDLKVKTSEVAGHSDDEPGHIDVLGVCSQDDRLIEIETLQAEDSIAETLLHENLHAMMALVGLRHSLVKREEDIVRRLSPVLLLWLRDNPRVIEFLTNRQQGGARSAP